MNETNYEFKIALIGSTNAGKSTLLERYINNKFQNLFATIGVNTTLKDVNIIVKKGNKIQEQLKVTLRISDTAGQERFRSLAPVYIKNAHCIVFVIDLFSESDYKEFNYWLNEINENKQSKSLYVICGTKIDLDNRNDRVFDFQFFDEFIRNEKGYYFETSSKLNKGIDEMFYFIAEECYNLFHNEINLNKTIQKSTNKNMIKKKKC
jgi:small GTP-binding protein